MTPKPPARRAKKGRAKPVKAWCCLDRNGKLTQHTFALEWGNSIRVLIVPADGSYIVKRKEARRGK